MKEVKRLIGENIKRFRGQLGESVDAMVEKTGIGRAYWYQLEAGTANATIDTLITVAKALGVALDQLTSDSSVLVYAQSEAPPHKKPKRRKAS